MSTVAERSILLASIASIGAIGASSLHAQTAGPRPPVRLCVAEVVADRPAARAGIAPGDCLLAIDGTPLDPTWIWISDEVVAEVRSRTLALRRGDGRRRLEIGPGDPGWTLRHPGQDRDAAEWRDTQAAKRAFEAGENDTAATLFAALGRHPASGRALEARFGQARLASRRGTHDEAAEHFATLAANLPAAAADATGLHPELIEAWVLEQWARAERTRGDLARSTELDERSLQLRVDHAPGSLAEASSIDSLTGNLFRRNELERSERLLRRGLELCRRLDPNSILEADLENDFGLVAWGRGDLAAAAERFAASLAIVRRLRPDSLRLAIDWNNLGLAAWNRGELDDAVAYHERALALRRRLDRDGLTVGASLTNLGNALFDQGDLRGAEAAHSEALSILERLAPDHLDTGHTLNNLANVSVMRGDWSWARELYLRALRIRERQAPDTVDVALTLNNLGIIAMDQGELDAAQSYFERSLEIHQKIAPGSHHVAQALTSLGNLAGARGDFELARRHYRGALDIDRLRAPGSISEARTRHNLARAEHELGDPAGAVEQLESALAIVRRAAAGGLEQAHALHTLAGLLDEQGDTEAAAAALEEALAIRQELAPGTIALADTLHRVGQRSARGGDPVAAERSMSLALEELERARRRAGGTAARTRLAAGTGYLYHDLALLQARRGRVLDALATLERGRAQALQEMLAERDVDWSAVLPDALAERRRELDRRRRLIEDRLARLAIDAGELEALHTELAVVRSEEDAFEEEVRRRVPGFAEVAYPRPLSAAALAAALERGILALVFSVGSDETLALAVRGNGEGGSEGRFHVAELSGDQLGEKVSFLRRWLAARVPDDDGAAWKLADELRSEIIGPLADWLAGADRILLMSDASLHLLPPSLLTAGGAIDARELGPPTSVIPSLAFLYRLRLRPRTTSAELTWAGFGDPFLQAAARPAVADRSTASRDDLIRPPELVALPGSRRELERVRRLIAGPSRLYLGAAASEEAARSLPAARVLHFASHGLIDHRSPASSSIVLSSGEAGGREQDGRLQAWEVIESLDLDADLVVLSACNTGLGQVAGGEGLLGLSRAFLLAGARSLLVSLWPVSDRGSSELMEHFYAALLDGASKDEALRRAQQAMLRNDRYRHPYYWATFELIGDPSPLTGVDRRRSILPSVLIAMLLLLTAAVSVARRRQSQRYRTSGFR